MGKCTVNPFSPMNTYSLDSRYKTITGPTTRPATGIAKPFAHVAPVTFGLSADTFTRSQPSAGAVSGQKSQREAADPSLQHQQAQAKERDWLARQREFEEAQRLAKEKKKQKDKIDVYKDLQRFRDVNKPQSLFRDGQTLTITIWKGAKKAAQITRETVGKWLQMRPEERENMTLPRDRKLRQQA